MAGKHRRTSSSGKTPKASKSKTSHARKKGAAASIYTQPRKALQSWTL